jgi:hypothetical protein
MPFIVRAKEKTAPAEIYLQVSLVKISSLWILKSSLFELYSAGIPS